MGLFPAFMNVCRSMGAYLFVDLDEQNKDILLVLRDVQIGVQTIQTHGVSGGGGGAPRLNTTGTMDAVTSTQGPVGATPTGKLRELQQRLQTSNTNVAQAVSALKGADSKKSSNMGFYMMILGYIVISYI